MNYTKDQTEYMIEKYKTNPSRDTVEQLADEFSKSVKSVIGKLSREGVYRREVYKTKTGENPVTKVEIVSNIADALGMEIDNLAGLEKAPKATLKTIERVLSEQTLSGVSTGLLTSRQIHRLQHKISPKLKKNRFEYRRLGEVARVSKRRNLT